MNLTFSGTAIVVWGSVDGQHGPYSASLRKASTPYADDQVAVWNAYSPFLAVPVPFFVATGLDPSQQYTLTLKNKAVNGTFLDLDYIDIYTSTGGEPPNGGFNGLLKPAPKHTNLPLTIGAVVDGVALLLLLIVLFWFIRKRRQARDQGTRPLDDRKGSSHGHGIPLQKHGNVTPYQPPSSPYALESQALLQRSPPLYHREISSTMSTTTGGYNPYAAYGGSLPTPPISSVYGSSAAGAGEIDPVQARRQGKAAEIEAVRMRIANSGSVGMLSPTTPNPATSTTNSTFGPSWEASSQGPSSMAQDPPSRSAMQMLYTTPDDPPPSYDQK